jgi:hypothetical protein
MPFHNSWLVEGRVIQNRLIGTVTAVEIMQSSLETTPLIDSGTPPVYFIVDVTKMTSYPTKLADFRSIYQQPISENLGLIIFYGIQSRTISFLATLVTQLIRVKFQVVKNQAEAIALIERLEGHKLIITHLDQLDSREA